MAERAYWVEDNEDWFGSILKGPGDFECCLGEPEDRNWRRDGAPAVDLLNAHHERIVELEAEVERLREALEVVRDEADHIFGSPTPFTSGWLARVRDAVRKGLGDA